MAPPQSQQTASEAEAEGKGKGKGKGETERSPSTTCSGSKTTGRRTAPRRTTSVRRNWYFVLVRMLLIQVSITVLLTGVLHTYNGAASFNILGAVLTRECTKDQALNGLWRFIATLYCGFCPLCIVIALDIVRYAPVLVLLSVTCLLAGCARVLTAFWIGVPGTPMGYFATYIASFFEIGTPLLLLLLLSLGFRFIKKQS